MHHDTTRILAMQKAAAEATDEMTPEEIDKGLQLERLHRTYRNLYQLAGGLGGAALGGTGTYTLLKLLNASPKATGLGTLAGTWLGGRLGFSLVPRLVLAGNQAARNMAAQRGLMSDADLASPDAVPDMGLPYK